MDSFSICKGLYILMATSMRGREYEIQAHSESDGCYCHEAEDLGGLIHSSDALELNILHRSFLFFAPIETFFLPFVITRLTTCFQGEI
jgi:hypothetical protein